jgi:hypothetical protein
MPLKKSYSSAAEVPEALKTAYIEKDGVWLIDIEGGIGDPAKLREFREANLELRREKEELQGKLDEAQELALKPQGKISEQVEALKQEHAKALAIAQGKATTAETELTKLRIETAVATEAVKRGVRPEAMQDFLRRGREELKTLDGKTIAIGADGGTRYNENGEPMTIGEWIAATEKQAPYFFVPNRGSGAGGSGSNGAGGGAGSYNKPNPFKAETRNMTEQGVLLKTNPSLAHQLAAEAGVKLPA